MKKMLPIDIEVRDCHMASLLTVINWNYQEYYRAFWDSWLVDYDETKPVAESIEGTSPHIFNNLRRFYGIKVKTIEGNNEEDIINQIDSYLYNNIPVVVLCDTFYCVWNDNYNKRHSDHVFILISKKENYFVVDVMPKKINIFIDRKNLLNGLKAAEIVNMGAVRDTDFKLFLDHTVSRKIRNGEQKKLQQFVDSLIASDVGVLLSEHKDVYVWSVPIIHNVRNLLYSRKQFVYILKELVDTEIQKDCYLYIEKTFLKIISKWTTVVNLMYKARIEDKYTDVQKSMFKYLREVVCLESMALRQIQDLLTDDLQINSENFNGEIHYLDINFNAISHYWEEKDFSRLTPIETGSIWKSGKIEFFFPSVSSDMPNCMICRRQRCEVLLKKYSSIHLIGYATWGDQEFSIVVQYIEGDQIETIKISDWCADSCFGERIVWKGNFEKRTNGEIYTGFIYDARISLNKTRLLKRVIFPQNENIVIFLAFLCD